MLIIIIRHRNPLLREVDFQLILSSGTIPPRQSATLVSLVYKAANFPSAVRPKQYTTKWCNANHACRKQTEHACVGFGSSRLTTGNSTADWNCRGKTCYNLNLPGKRKITIISETAESSARNIRNVRPLPNTCFRKLKSV